MRELLAGLVPGLPEQAVEGDRRPRRRDPAVRGRDRPDARSPRVACASRTAPTVPAGDLDDPRRARDADGADRVPTRRPRPPRTGRWSRTPPCSARASRWPASRRCPGSDAAELEPRLRGLVRRELLDARGRPAHPGARPVRVRPGADPRGRLQHAGQATTARCATSPPPGSSRPWATDELAGALAGHYLAAHANAPEGAGGATPSAAQARIALQGARPNEPRRWVPTTRRSPS